MNTIWNTLPTNTCTIANHRGLTYVADVKVAYRLTWDNWGARLSLIDLTDALRRGKTCDQLAITAEMGAFIDDHGTNGGLNFILNLIRENGYNLRSVMIKLMLADWQQDARFPTSWSSVEYMGAQIHRYTKKAVRTFSPFSKVPALQQVPARWTLDLVVRALLNGQFTDCHCDAQYTDDYAFDAATNFGQGACSGMALAKRLVDDPSGWWTNYESDGVRIGVNCHHFLNYSFTPAFIGDTAKANA